MAAAVPVCVGGLTEYVTTIFEHLGIGTEGASKTARALVAGDVAGTPSHGVMLVPMYVDRLIAGSISKAPAAEIIHDGGPVVVLDALHALGQITSHQAVATLCERVRSCGLATVGVRNAFHFGAAGYWARIIAEQGNVGLAMCNTRPLMPATGGGERLVGNNPVAIAVPAEGEPPLVHDMALSAAAMGSIRLAASLGERLPDHWATDPDGAPTNDPVAAIKGMLLPAGQHKGFGLAVMIDLLCGGLSGGSIGEEVSPLYGDPVRPYGCSHMFAAVAPSAFGASNFRERVTAFAGKIRGSRRLKGVDRIYAPGDRQRERSDTHRSTCFLHAEVLAGLKATATKLGIAAPPAMTV